MSEQLGPVSPDVASILEDYFREDMVDFLDCSTWKIELVEDDDA